MKLATLLLALSAATASAAANSEPVLLDFHAQWCGPCHQMRPIVERLVQSGYPVRAIDIDKSPELAQRYKVSTVPAFIVVDSAGRVLDRSGPVGSAKQLADFYDKARQKVQDAPEREEPAAASSAPTNPNPWETTVRIKIDIGRTIGFGSGTIIHSTPEESIILTCGHIFKTEGARQYPPSKFPYRIRVDLFDGQLRGTKPAQVHFKNETYEGEVIDYDFARDVGLVRIRPEKRLPASRVVPPSWQPQVSMSLRTVGCSEGHDATAWSTVVTKAGQRYRVSRGSDVYEAIECLHAPKQGRSGGGLFTDDGYITGVCNFAEPVGKHGLYATPRSIHYLLDKNNLTALYQPARSPGQSQQLLASNRSRQAANTKPALVRAQSAEREDTEIVTIPPPELLGIPIPAARTAEEPAARPAADQRTAWRSTHTPLPGTQTERTDLKIDPAADNDLFRTVPFSPPTATTSEPAAGAASAAPAPGGSKWRPVRTISSPASVGK